MNVLEQVQQSARELGLPVPVSVASTQDMQAVQLYGLLNALGQELVDQYRWQRMERVHEFYTVLGQSTYPLPSDWQGQIDQTEWDRTNHWPLLGQKTPQEWQWLKGGVLSQGPRTRFRIVDDHFEIFPAGTQDNWHFVFEYMSNGWCYDPAAPNVRLNTSTQDTDVTVFTDRLMIAGIKLKFFEIKGFNTQALQKDYDKAFSVNMSRDHGAPRLTLSPRPANIYVGPWNVPDGSWPVA